MWLKTGEPGPTVKKIMFLWLFQYGYDGLWNEHGDCACSRNDLDPGDCLSSSCHAGHDLGGGLIGIREPTEKPHNAS